MNGLKWHWSESEATWASKHCPNIAKKLWEKFGLGSKDSGKKMTAPEQNNCIRKEIGPNLYFWVGVLRTKDTS